MQVLYREHAAGAYSKMPFALALCCVEIPYNTVETFLFSCVSYCAPPPLSTLPSLACRICAVKILICLPCI